MSEKDVRWKHRFSNYKKALDKLREALGEYDDEMTGLEKEGMIQRFEYTFELAWKTLQDLLYERGYRGQRSNSCTEASFARWVYRR